MTPEAKAEANNVTRLSETVVSFTCGDVPYYLDWSLEPLTILYTAFKLNDSVDLDKAREVARDLSSEYDTLSIRIKDDRDMAVCCSTIVPDMKSLWAVTPYLLEIVRNALDLFMNAYEKAISGQESN